MAFKNDKQRKAAFANMNRTRQAWDSDLSKNALNIAPHTSDGIKEWRQNPGRIDIIGVDTKPTTPEEREKIKRIKSGILPEEPPKKDDIEQYTQSKEEFFKTYPEGHVSIPSGYNDREFLVLNMDESSSESMAISSGLSEKDIRASAKSLENKGYIKTRPRPSGGLYIDREKGAVARWMYDNKGDYADQVYGELQSTAKKHLVTAKTERMKETAARHDAISEMESRSEQLLYQSNVKKYARLTKEMNKHNVLLKSNNVELVGNKKLKTDVDYVLNTYFNINPDTLKDNILYLKYSKSYKFAGMLRENRQSTGLSDPWHIRTVLINSNMYKNSDIKTDKNYLDTMIHELVHWQRKVDTRRSIRPTVLETSSRYDRDSEEKNTVKETSARVGERASSDMKGYYQYLKSTKNAPDYDNRILTISPKLHSDKKLSQVAENLEMRGRATAIDRLTLVGRSEWIDTFYQTKNGVYQAYNPSPAKDFNPSQIAREIDMEDNIKGNENVHEWRDGKKHILIKKTR